MRYGWLLIGFLLLLLTGCDGGASAVTPTPVPQTLLQQAAQHIQDADSFAVTIEREGAPAIIDVAGIINFVRATGSYVAPDRVQARVRALVVGIAGDVDVIAVGDQQYYRHSILTGGQWLNAIFSPGFNAQEFVQSERGIVRALNAVTALENAGVEDIDGVPMWHLHGEAIGSEVSVLTFGLIPAQSDVIVDVYIRMDDGYPERLIVLEPETGVQDEQGQPLTRTWTVELYDYNGGHQIEAPGDAIVGPTAVLTPEVTGEQ